MEQLLQDMPINKADGSKGLLHHGTFGDAVHERLPLYDVSKVTDSVSGLAPALLAWIIIRMSCLAVVNSLVVVGLCL